jgi:hypothetical protein
MVVLAGNNRRVDISSDLLLKLILANAFLKHYIPHPLRFQLNIFCNYPDLIHVPDHALVSIKYRIASCG